MHFVGGFMFQIDRSDANKFQCAFHSALQLFLCVYHLPFFISYVFGTSNSKSTAKIETFCFQINWCTLKILTSDPCSESLARYTFLEKFSNNPWMWATVISEFMFTVVIVVGIVNYWTPHLLRSHSALASFNSNKMNKKK